MMRMGARMRDDFTDPARPNDRVLREDSGDQRGAVVSSEVDAPPPRLGVAPPHVAKDVKDRGCEALFYVDRAAAVAV